jgi:hypothetical protein
VRIYFSGAISGGRDKLPVYQHIVTRLKSLDHDVPSDHVAARDVLSADGALSPRQVYERDVRWIEDSDAMIAEISTPSLGVGYEIGYALQRGKPVLCLYRDGLFVSKMITGNPSPLLSVAVYRNETELDEHIGIFLSRIALP